MRKPGDERRAFCCAPRQDQMLRCEREGAASTTSIILFGLHIGRRLLHKSPRADSFIERAPFRDDASRAQNRSHHGPGLPFTFDQKIICPHKDLKGNSAPWALFLPPIAPDCDRPRREQHRIGTTRFTPAFGSEAIAKAYQRVTPSSADRQRARAGGNGCKTGESCDIHNLAGRTHRVISWSHAAGLTGGIQEMKPYSRFLEKGAAGFCPNRFGKIDTSRRGSQGSQSTATSRR